MIRTPLALVLAITATCALVQGCSMQGDSTLSEEGSGDDNPQGGAVDNAGDQGQAGEPAAPPSTESPGETPATPAPEPPPPPKSTMTFFVTSTGTTNGGNLGGLEGADKKCQDLAAAVGGGDHTWRAYLSAEGVNAKDRIGPGPWFNQKGELIASNVEELHQYNRVFSSALMLDEKGNPVPEGKTMILTGTKHDGTALPQTCNNWTSNQNNQQHRAGDAAADTNPLLGVRWNDAVKNYGCSQNAINQNKGEGRLYCFAVD